MKKILLLILIFVVSNVSVAKVIGYLDYSVENSDGFQIRGWACDEGINTSIDVHLYVNANEKLIASGKANISSESAISQLCRTNGVKHRFYVDIPGYNLRKYQGQPITAYGISKTGGANNKLKFSREIPTVPTSDIIGYLDALYSKNGKFYIRGWACQKGINQSIKVHAYVAGSAYEGGTYAFQGVANKILSPGISGLCNTSNIPHRFVIQIPESVINKHEGKNIVVHGIRTFGGHELNELLNITNTDRYTYKIPAIHPAVYEFTDLAFHPLHYYWDANYEAITNGQVYSRATQSRIYDREFTLSGAHSIASDESNIFFAANTMVLKRDENNNLVRDSEGNFIKSREGAIVQFDISKGKTTASHKNNSSYPLFSPHDIIFNKADQYYYYIDSHWHSPYDYLVRFKSYEEGFSNTEAIKLNSLYPNQKFYARSLSIYQDGETQKIIIGVSSHGQVILVDSFSDSLLNANFEVKKVINKNRQNVIDTIGASGSYDTTGFVFNDVEYYDGYYYGTNFFRAQDCQSNGCADKFRFVRWKTWEDFEKDNIEDLSYLIQNKRIPYYMTVVDENLYIATIPDKKALSGGEIRVPKIYVLYPE